MGIPKDSVVKYEGAIRDRPILEIVYGTAAEVAKARVRSSSRCTLAKRYPLRQFRFPARFTGKVNSIDFTLARIFVEF
jgi:hypothetical protein